MTAHRTSASSSPRLRLRPLVIAVVGAIGISVIPAAAASAAPSNDDLGAAAPVALGWTVADLTEASVEPGEPTECIEYDPDLSSYSYIAGSTVWYRFTSDATQTVHGSISDYVEQASSVHVFREVGGALESVTCADSDDRSTFNFQAAAGEEFVIQVGAVDWGGDLLDEATLFLSALPAIPNTTPDTATQLAVPSTTSQWTFGTDYELSLPYGCNPEDGAIMRDVWYRVTAPGNGPLTFDASASDFDVNLAVYPDTPGTPDAPIGCPPIGSPVDGYPGTAAAVVTIPAVAGQSFLVQVGGFYLHSGTAVLSVSQIVAAPTVTRVGPLYGPRAGGTVVTITGTGFTPDAQVRFGGLPAASVSYVSPTRLTAVTPRVSSARLVEVTVITPAGTSAKALLAKFLYVK